MQGFPTKSDFPEAISLLEKHRSIATNCVVIHDEREFELHPDVLSPFLTKTTQFFAKHINTRHNSNILEIGTGTGYILVTVGTRSRNVNLSGVDISPHAAELTRRNIHRNNLKASIYCGSLFSPLPDFRYDHIIFNPPLLSVGDAADSLQPLEQAIFDPNGIIIEKFFSKVGNFLSDRGIIHLIYTDRQNSELDSEHNSTIKILATNNNLEHRTIAKLPVGYETYFVYELEHKKTPQS